MLQLLENNSYISYLINAILLKVEKLKKNFFKWKAINLDPFDYHDFNCCENASTELDYEQLHTHFTNDEDQKEDDNAIPDPPMVMEYHIGNDEMVKIFNQKCVICLESPSIYAFCLCGHQFILENFFKKVKIMLIC